MNDRTMIAAMCLAGKIAASTVRDREKSVKSCVEYADALLKEIGELPTREILQIARDNARNEALEEAAQFVERALEESSMLADQIRALKKSEVK